MSSPKSLFNCGPPQSPYSELNFRIRTFRSLSFRCGLGRKLFSKLLTYKPMTRIKTLVGDSYMGVWMATRSVPVGLKLVICLMAVAAFLHCVEIAQAQPLGQTIQFESIQGDIWISGVPKSLSRLGPNAEVTVKIWFNRQLLGEGDSYRRRIAEFDSILRSDLRARSVRSLKQEAEKSFLLAKESLDDLRKNGLLTDFRRHWIVNGFSATTRLSAIERFKRIPGVSKIFVVGKTNTKKGDGELSTVEDRRNNSDFSFDPERWLHPWYTRALKADKVWSEFGVSGKGTLNIIHDFHFSKSPPMDKSKSSIVGFNFNNGTTNLCIRPESSSTRDLHGVMCAAIVCGRGSPDFGYEFGLAPSGEWAGVISSGEIESSVEWAIENAADTYSMSFSIPGLGEYRSHWRKILEHGAICGICFVSGAGNFAKTVKTPLQMRTPEDIPEVVFAAAGVHRNLSKTSFSSTGPVLWKTEHYDEGEVQKPEVCAFNHQLPVFFIDGTVRESAINGNSFAGPMFCGSIALMRSADPELHPWRIRKIITSTASDIGTPGFDSSTGHGLINCYRAVKEVLRQKAIRDGKDPSRYQQELAKGQFDEDNYLAKLSSHLVVVNSGREAVGNGKTNLLEGDIIKRVEGAEVTSEGDWAGLIARSRGQSLKIKVIRGQKPVEIQVSAAKMRFRKVREVYAEPVFK